MSAGTVLLSWHGDPLIKAVAVASMHAHRAADEIMQGRFVQLNPDSDSGFRGCFHGCLTGNALMAERNITPVQLTDVHVEWHAEGERLWGIPRRLGYMLDKMFEALPPRDCAAFAVDVTEAIPVGVDLSQVVDRWMLDILTNPAGGVARYTNDGTAQHAAIEAVAELYRRRLAGSEPTLHEWTGARLQCATARRAVVNGYETRTAFALSTAAYAAARLRAVDEAWQAVREAADANLVGIAQRWQAQRLIHRVATAWTDQP